jgi:hypothetical protein
MHQQQNSMGPLRGCWGRRHCAPVCCLDASDKPSTAAVTVDWEEEQPQCRQQATVQGTHVFRWSILVVIIISNRPIQSTIGWMMIYKGSGRKWSWLNRGTTADGVHSASLSITEELLEWKSSAFGSWKPRLTAVGIHCADHATPSNRKSWH